MHPSELDEGGYSEIPIDKHVEAVRRAMFQRMSVGYKKYGTTTERTDIDLMGWLQHLQEELMDAAVYVERIKDELRTSASSTTRNE
jgi:hypothetical protein